MDSLQNKFNKLSAYEVRLIRWNDERGHRRLWLDRVDENNYFFIVEKPTIEECLDSAIDFLSSKTK